MQTAGDVVVGVDGSAQAIRAAAWAAREAVRHGTALRLVHAYVVPARGYPDLIATFPQLREGMRYQGEEWLGEALAAVRRVAPELEVRRDLIETDPVHLLLRLSKDARLLVLGSRGLGGFSGLLLGSVALAMAMHADAPVVVVRGRRPEDEPPETGPVVVGLDGSPASAAAVEFAFEAASARGVGLIAVHSWNEITVGQFPLTVDPAQIESDHARMLADQLAGWPEKYPEVPVERVVARGRPVGTLSSYGDHAQLIVVGSRGRGGFTGMLLGSTSHALLAHSPCPVAVVRP